MKSGGLVVSFPRPGRWIEYGRSLLRSPDIDRAVIDDVMGQYDLGLTQNPHNLPNTRRNQNLVVETGAGRFVLKQYRIDWSQSTIAFEHSVLARLAELDFPAPRLAWLPHGSTWVESGGRTYSLFRFIPGRNYSSRYLLRSHRVSMMRTAGLTLARLHKRLRGFHPEGQHHLGFRDYDGDRHRDLRWHEKMVGELTERSHDLEDEQDRSHAAWLVQRAGDILDELHGLDASLKELSLPRFLIHGDYGLHNLLFRGPTLAIPVDFELCRLDWRLSELVSVTSKMRFNDGSLDFESVGQFLEGYRSESVIEEAEWQHFSSVWRFHKLMKAVQYWKSYFETGGPTRKLLSARAEVEQSSWAFDNRDLVDVL